MKRIALTSSSSVSFLSFANPEKGRSEPWHVYAPFLLLFWLPPHGLKLSCVFLTKLSRSAQDGDARWCGIEIYAGRMALTPELDQPVHDLRGARPVGRLEHHLDRRERRLVEHRAQLGEGGEALVAVVVAHAAGAHAAERQVVLGHVHQPL